MRAGTRMPGFLSAGISQMESPAGRAHEARSPVRFIDESRGSRPRASDVDDDTGLPSVPSPRRRELMEGDGLRIGAEHRAAGLDHAAAQTRLEPIRTGAADM